MVPLHIAQEMLQMDAATQIETDDQGNPVLDDGGNPIIIGERPARVTMIFVAAAEDITPEDLKTKVEAVYDRVQQDLDANDVPFSLPLRTARPSFIQINTWEEQNASLIEPVEKECGTLYRASSSRSSTWCARGLCSRSSGRSCTRRLATSASWCAIGASRRGVLAIFLRYGVAIGIGGAMVGIAIAFPIVHYINEIQDALAAPPLILAFIAALPGVLALAWTAAKGGLRGIAFIGAVLALLGIVCGGPLRDPSVTSRPTRYGRRPAAVRKSVSPSGMRADQPTLIEAHAGRGRGSQPRNRPATAAPATATPPRRRHRSCG